MYSSIISIYAAKKPLTQAFLSIVREFVPILSVPTQLEVYSFYTYF